MIFHGIAVKPGKPTAFALVDGRPSLRHARQSDLVPVERVHPARAVSPRHGAAAAYSQPRTVRVPLGRRIVSPAGRHQFYTVRLHGGGAHPGVQRLRRHHQPVAGRRLHRDSADQSVVERGTMVDVTLF